MAGIDPAHSLGFPSIRHARWSSTPTARRPTPGALWFDGAGAKLLFELDSEEPGLDELLAFGTRVALIEIETHALSETWRAVRMQPERWKLLGVALLPSITASWIGSGRGSPRQELGAA